MGEGAEELPRGGYTAVWCKARKLNYMRLPYLKGEIVREQCTEEYSIKAVAVFEEEMDKGDKFLIYRINDGSFNNQPDYVFKSSKEMGQLMLTMNVNREQNNLMQEQVSYFDEQHK